MKLYVPIHGQGLISLSKIFFELNRFGIRDKIVFHFTQYHLYIYPFDKDSNCLKQPNWFCFRMILKDLSDADQMEVASISRNEIKTIISKEDFVTIMVKISKCTKFSRGIISLTKLDGSPFIKLSMSSQTNDTNFEVQVPTELGLISEIPHPSIGLRLKPKSKLLATYLNQLASDKNDLEIHLNFIANLIKIKFIEESSRREVSFPTVVIDRSHNFRQIKSGQTVVFHMNTVDVKKMQNLFEFGSSFSIGITEDDFFFVELSNSGKDSINEDIPQLYFGFANAKSEIKAYD